MFDTISEEAQLILTVIVIAVLFVLVTWNTKRNKNKLYNRNERNYRKNYFKKKTQETDKK